jgi:hypothetical protein
MSYCPACGNPVSDATARFCMKCGRELPAAAAPPPPAAPPTPTQVSPAPLAPPPSPPTYAAPTATYPGAGPAGYPAPAAPAPPSPAALFGRRVFGGPWGPALTAALVPALALLVAAGALGAWSQHFAEGPVSWWTRTRLALAVVMQGLGGHLSAKEPGSSGCLDYGGSDYDDSGYGGSDSGDYSGFGSSCSQATSGFSMLLLVFTLLYLLALILALRSMRRRQAGAEAAVRVALLSAAAAMVLAFVGQVKLEGVRLHDGPFLVLLWTFLISLVTALAVLHGPALSARLGAAFRVAGAAFLGLVVTVLFAGVIVFLIAVGYQDDLGMNGDGIVGLGLAVPNLGVPALALGFGAPFEAGTSGSRYGGDTAKLGLSQLNDVWGGAGTPLALTAAAVCALIVGFLAVRRTRSTAEQFAVAAAYTAMFTVLVSIADLTVGNMGGMGFGSYLAGGGERHFGSSVPKALLFSLLWSAGGVMAASFLTRVFSGPPPVSGQGVSYAPYGASPYGQAPYGAPPANPYAAGQPAQAPAPYIPPQAQPPAQPVPQPQPQPQSESEPQPQPHPQPSSEVPDLGVVQPDRLTKREEQGEGDAG